MTIRQAQDKKQDCDMVFYLSNDPLVRACSFNSNQIEYENHCKWFENTIKDKNTLFFLIFDDDNFVGQMRFNREIENSINCIISLSITKEYRGKHIASDFLQLGIEALVKKWYNIKSITAEVKEENLASNKLFLKNNFELIKQDTYNSYRLMVR